MPGLNSAIRLPHNRAQVEIRQSSTVMVRRYDPRRDLPGAGLFGLAGSAGLGTMIGPDPVIAAR